MLPELVGKGLTVASIIAKVGGSEEEGPAKAVPDSLTVPMAVLCYSMPRSCVRSYEHFEAPEPDPDHPEPAKDNYFKEDRIVTKAHRSMLSCFHSKRALLCLKNREKLLCDAEVDPEAPSADKDLNCERPE